MLAATYNIGNSLLRFSRENFHFAPYMDKGCTIPSKNVYKNFDFKTLILHFLKELHQVL